MLAWGSDPLSNPVWPSVCACKIKRFGSNLQALETFFIKRLRARPLFVPFGEQVGAEAACAFKALCEFPLFDFGLVA